MQDWHSVWNRREAKPGEDRLQALIDLDGFDSGAGRIAAPDWRKYTSLIADRLGLKKGQSVYEVGCGAGAFLYPLAEQGIRVGGMDYANNLISAARAALPGGRFEHGEASTLAVSPVYDFVLANSVFHYFPSAEYSRTVVERMLQKARVGAAILELPDRALQESAERMRQDALSPAAYREKYRGLEHRYYDRAWFAHLAEQHGWRCDIFDQCVPNYAQSGFRFNCVFLKKESLS